MAEGGSLGPVCDWDSSSPRARGHKASLKPPLLLSPLPLATSQVLQVLNSKNSTPANESVGNTSQPSRHSSAIKQQLLVSMILS